MPSALSRSFSVPINANRFSLIAKCSDPLDPTANNCQTVNGVSGSLILFFLLFFYIFFFLFLFFCVVNPPLPDDAIVEESDRGSHGRSSSVIRKSIVSL